MSRRAGMAATLPVAVIILGTLSTGCAMTGQNMFIDAAQGCTVPLVTTADQCREHNGRRVTVKGRYLVMRLPRSARPGSPLFPSDRIVIELADGHHLALETHDAGIRPADEKKRCLDRTVLVTGRMTRFAQLWGRPHESAIVMDAVTSIESLSLADR